MGALKSLWGNVFGYRKQKLWTEGSERPEYGVSLPRLEPIRHLMRTLLFTLVTLLVLGGCGVLPPVDTPFPGGEPRATVVINNFETGYLGVAIFINSMSGGNWRLGRVSTAGSMALPFPGMREGEYFLEARISGQQPIRSEQFLLSDGQTVEWHLGDNRISYRAP